MHQKIIGRRYAILKKIGSGAIGDVYKIRDLRDNRIIALKMISKKMADSETVKRFQREFKLLTELHHPNLCEVYDFGVLKDGRSYFTMEFIDGKDIFKAAKGLSYEKIYPWVVQLCRVLEYIHSKGLIHYDIKPSNILVAKSREQRVKSGKANGLNSQCCVKLMDFGFAGEQRIKGGALIKGTFPYIAPELIKGFTVDHRADLYSLGILLYEIFTRKALHVDRKTGLATFLSQQRKLVSVPPSKIVADIPASGRLERLILRLIAPKPAGRFGRANEVIKEINKLSRIKLAPETEKTLEGYLLSSQFVGRDKEMKLLKSLYEKAQQGRGKVVLVTGDAGIGKSRLLKEFKIFVQLQHSYCFTGYVYKDKIGSLEPFYEIFKELIHHIDFKPKLSQKLKLSFAVLFKFFPDLKKGHLKRNMPKLVSLEPKQEKLRTFEALSELIRHTASELGELVILLEDLHWADDFTIGFLEYLGRNLENRNILICGTCRKDESKKNQVLQRMITNSLKDGYLVQIDLAPFRFKSLYSFLDSTITPSSNSSELIKYLMRKTGGNPFFVEETMRILVRNERVTIGEKIEVRDVKQIAIPRRIEDIVLKRMKDLDHNAQRIVRYAAILLKDFSYQFMKQLTHLSDTKLSRSLWELKREKIMVEEGNNYRFYHAILREAVHTGLGDKEISDLNYQIGKTLEKINRGRLNKIVEDLAYYFINARDHTRGISYGLRAAKKSGEKYANEQAVRFYKGVLSLLSKEKRKLRFNIFRELAGIEIVVGHYNDAIKYYNRAFNLKPSAANKKIEDYLAIISIYGKKGEHNKVLHSCQEGIKFLKKIAPTRFKLLLQTYINVIISRTYLFLGDQKSASKYKFDILQFPEAGLRGEKATRLKAHICANIGVIENLKGKYGKGDYDKAISSYRKAYKYYKKIKHDYGIASTLSNLGYGYYRKFDVAKAFACYQKSIRLSEKNGYQHIVSNGFYSLGNILRDRGYYVEASRYLQKALFISKKIEDPQITGFSYMLLGVCFCGLCDYKKAKEYFERALKIFDIVGWEEKKFPQIMYIGFVHQAIGDYTLALRYYRKALKMAKGIKHNFGNALLLINIGSIFIEFGEFLKARRYINDALRIVIPIGLKESEIECYIYLCRISIMMKDYVVARNYYEIGIRMAKKLGMRQQLLRFLLLTSEIYFYEEKYLRGIKTANKAIRLAKNMKKKDLHARALLIKVKNGMKHGYISKIEAFTILGEAKKIAEEIGSPEILWKVYFEYGRYLQSNGEFLEALDYYQKCNGIFRDIISKIKNESYRKSYLHHPDRQTVDIAIKEIESTLH